MIQVPPVAVHPQWADARRCLALVRWTQRLGLLPPPGVEVRQYPLSSEVPVAQALPQAGRSLVTWLTALRRRVVRAAEHHWTTAGLGVEFTLLTELRRGAQHALHADNERPDGRGGWEPNHTPFRCCTGMVYLNTCGVEFTGGEIYFPRVGVTVPPAPGTLVLLDCGRAHEHGVYPVQRGVRYALSVWMTRDPAHYERWPD